MGTENAFIPLMRLVADNRDSMGRFHRNVVFYKMGTEIVIKLIGACFPKFFKKKKKEEQ